MSTDLLPIISVTISRFLGWFCTLQPSDLFLKPENSYNSNKSITALIFWSTKKRCHNYVIFQRRLFPSTDIALLSLLSSIDVPHLIILTLWGALNRQPWHRSTGTNSIASNHGIGIGIDIGTDWSTTAFNHNLLPIISFVTTDQRRQFINSVTISRSLGLLHSLQPSGLFLKPKNSTTRVLI